MRAWVLYSLVRLGIFAAAFGLLYWLLDESLWWVAAICAAIIALAISYIFLGPLRRKVSEDLAARIERRRAGGDDPDAAAEDTD